MIFQVLPEPIEEFLRVLEFWDHIFSGFLITMWLYGLALTIGFFIGLFLAILRHYGGWLFSRIATGYIEFMRGTPLLAQLLFFYYLPIILNLSISEWNFEISFIILDKNISLILLNHATIVGILTLSLNSAAYQAEYFRGAIISVGYEQMFAAQSIGMSRLKGIRYIVIPQALRRVIPAWSNEAAYLPKYTVVVYFIGVRDLFREAFFIVSYTFLSLATYILIAIIFLITISIISKLLDVAYNHIKTPGF